MSRLQGLLGFVLLLALVQVACRTAPVTVTPTVALATAVPATSAPTAAPATATVAPPTAVPATSAPAAAPATATVAPPTAAPATSAPSGAPATPTVLAASATPASPAATPLPPIPTVTPQAPAAGPSPTAAGTAGGTPAPTAATPGTRPNVYVSAFWSDPVAPRRGQLVQFYVTFVNATGAVRSFDWAVAIYDLDSGKRFGETKRRSENFPVGTTTRPTAQDWGVRGPGPCLPLRARVEFQNDNGLWIAFTTADGAPAALTLTVCQ